MNLEFEEDHIKLYTTEITTALLIIGIIAYLILSRPCDIINEL
jgi:hypothetical protein